MSVRKPFGISGTAELGRLPHATYGKTSLFHLRRVFAVLHFCRIGAPMIFDCLTSRRQEVTASRATILDDGHITEALFPRQSRNPNFVLEQTPILWPQESCHTQLRHSFPEAPILIHGTESGPLAYSCYPLHSGPYPTKSQFHRARGDIFVSVYEDSAFIPPTAWTSTSPSDNAPDDSSEAPQDPTPPVPADPFHADWPHWQAGASVPAAGPGPN